MASKTKKTTAASTVRNIWRNSRKRYSGEEKIRILLEGLRGEETVAELCRLEGISESVYYRWGKEFQEAGNQRPVGNTKRRATSDEVVDLRRENEQLKQLPAAGQILKRKLDEILDAYDYVLLDCPPSLCMLTIIVLTAAQLLIDLIHERLGQGRSFRYYAQGELEIEDEALKQHLDDYDPGREFIVVLLKPAAQWHEGGDERRA